MQPLADRVPQRLLAIREMRASRDVEQQPVRRIERHERRPAIGIVGQALEQAVIGGGVEIGDDERRHAGARIGERQAGREAEGERRLVHGGKPAGAFFSFGDENERRLIRRGGLSIVPSRRRRSAGRNGRNRAR